MRLLRAMVAALQVQLQALTPARLPSFDGNTADGDAGLLRAPGAFKPPAALEATVQREEPAAASLSEQLLSDAQTEKSTWGAPAALPHACPPP